MRRIVAISLYNLRRPSLVTSTSREGVSVLWALKESSCSLTENGVEPSSGIDCTSCVESAPDCKERAKG